MPGFNISSGFQNQKNSVSEPRRKHRWIMETLGPLTPTEALYLQKASRPSFKYDEVEMHHDQEKAYFAGKQEWEAMALGWYDIEQDPDVSEAVAKWLNIITTNFLNVGNLTGVALPSAYKKEAKLSMTSGEQGSVNESWTLYNCWPSTTNWGDLDYTTSDIAMIEMTLRFDRAVRTL